MSYSKIEREFVAETKIRDDATTYVGDLLVRQRKINHEVVDFAREVLPEGSVVVDACAGPEGSLLASALAGYQWIGNEVSVRFADNLRRTGARNVVLSDFSHAPFKDSSVDGVFLIFALNNIANTRKAVEEAARITKEQGVIVAADPGPSRWIGNILVHGLFKNSEFEDYVKGFVFDTEIPEFFKDRPYTEETFVNHFIVNRLGTTPSSLFKRFSEILGSAGDSKRRRKKALFVCQEEVIKLFYSFTRRLFNDNGFEVVKSAIGIVGRKGDDEWEIPPLSESFADSWLDDLMLMRNEKGPLYKELPQNLKDAGRKMFFPVLVLRKK